MGQTIIEKIISQHSDSVARPGEIADVEIDVRVARDFGGANVVKNLQNAGLKVADPRKTLFTFDTNPGGSDQGYAANQQFCREYAREHGIGLRDITQGIGTHLAIEDGLVGPGSTFISTDSHANIMGAVGAFGQGMGDQDIAAAWANGSIWFKVPHTIKIYLKGTPGPLAKAKDIVLAMARQLGAGGLLGCAAEIYGDIVDEMPLADRVTIASMCTEMGGIAALFTPNDAIMEYCNRNGGNFLPIAADADAQYKDSVEIDIEGLEPMAARPGHPEDVVPVSELVGRPIDSVFIGSCTNGRLEDLRMAASVLRGKKVADSVVLKVVPSTRSVWEAALEEGVVKELMDAGALIGNAGCAGCAAGQIGQNGPGEVTISTGNRNYAGKQGKGEVYLASPATAAACALAGVICREDDIPAPKAPAKTAEANDTPEQVSNESPAQTNKPTVLKGRVWLVDEANIDTDMIFHNRHLAVTELSEMGQHAFGNLPGWEDFPSKAQEGDLVITGPNFGCGSSRQQAVDCFTALGVKALIAPSYGAIYERNAINAGMPVLVADLLNSSLKNGTHVEMDLETGKMTWEGGDAQADPFSKVQMDIYQRGGLLAR
ncbi:MAG: homoaconitate hydratase family protein [bacterium]|nr:homoaconitate hydratase family protein [bacterium]